MIAALALLAAGAVVGPVPMTGVLTLPPGVVEISSEIRIPRGAHNLEIRGAAGGTTLVAADGFHGRAIIVCESGAQIRFADFTVDGNRAVLEQRSGLPPSDVPFARFTRNNGILVESTSNLEISNVRFVNIPGFAILVGRSRDVTIKRVHVSDSGSRNAKGRNNATGGILLEEGTSGFHVEDCVMRDVRGNGIWTHSLYTSPRNRGGSIIRNRFRDIGRDAIQVGHATRVRVAQNHGVRIGYPVSDVDMEDRAIPVAIDTAGNTDHCAYAENHFEEINGKCIDLDGFHDGEIRSNVCLNRRPPEAYPYGNYGIVMNDSNPDMYPENIRIVDNVIDGPLFGGIFVIGTHNFIARNQLRNLNTAHCNEDAAKFGCYYASGEPDMLRSGIYLGKGAERPAPARNNVIKDNRISGFKMRTRCITAAPGISLSANQIRDNICMDQKSSPPARIER